MGDPDERPEKHAARAEGHGIKPNAAPDNALIEQSVFEANFFDALTCLTQPCR